MTRKLFSRKTFALLVCVVAFSALLMLFAFAADNTVYLDSANGDDTYAGTSPSAAFKTLDKAINSVKDGGRV
ncbi:MAG: hypothetical protein IJC81_05545, partial [Clostridia bacterium]|nr:hypothetical protein [Clostridia bacterium]